MRHHYKREKLMKRTYFFEGEVKMELPRSYEASGSTGIDMVVECEVVKGDAATKDSPAQPHEIEILSIYIDGLSEDGGSSLSYLWNIRPTKHGLKWLMSDKDVDVVLQEIYDRVDDGSFGIE
tara:strand:+ start:169 stop:534 length:366 start_codon:yes stop_codon:yes gene_type:complete